MAVDIGDLSTIIYTPSCGVLGVDKRSRPGGRSASGTVRTSSWASDSDRSRCQSAFLYWDGGNYRTWPMSVRLSGSRMTRCLGVSAQVGCSDDDGPDRYDEAMSTSCRFARPAGSGRRQGDLDQVHPRRSSLLESSSQEAQHGQGLRRGGRVRGPIERRSVASGLRRTRFDSR